jgi:magnesium and cobalt transporter
MTSPPLFAPFREWLKTRLGRARAQQEIRDTIEEIIEERQDEQTPILDGERTLLANILQLGSVTVKDVMVPRSDIIAIDGALNFAEIVRAVIESGHSRLPVYRETLDEVIGILHVKDVFTCFAENKQADLPKMFRPPLFISPSMRALDLLLKMRTTHKHLALVVDEYGGIDGLVTIENLIEEIVGEIEDEHDVIEAPRLMPRGDGTVFADARATIDEFSTWAEVDFTAETEDQEIDTVGGLVFALAGRVPARGEIITHPAGIEFEILDADPRRIKRVRAKKVAG